MKSIGFLLCLISLYLMNAAWGSVGLVIGGYLFPAGAIVAFIGIIKEFDKEDKAKNDL